MRSWKNVDGEKNGGDGMDPMTVSSWNINPETVDPAFHYRVMDLECRAVDLRIALSGYQEIYSRLESHDGTLEV